jgi:hypothetical protein
METSSFCFLARCLMLFGSHLDKLLALRRHLCSRTSRLEKLAPLVQRVHNHGKKSGERVLDHLQPALVTACS